MPSPKLKRYSLSWGPRTPLKRGLSPRRAVGTPKWRARSRCASPLSLENLRVREQDVLQNSRASGPLRWRAGTHRYDPLGLGHLPVEPGHPLCHLPREGAGDDHDVSLPWGGREGAGAETVVVGHAGGHHLDGATREPELQGPQGVLPGPVEQLVRTRRYHVRLVELLHYTHLRAPFIQA